MKILHTVESYYPSVGGSQEVVKQISERLVKLGHDVTVATSKRADRRSHSHNGVKIAEFDIAGKEVIGYTGQDVARYKKFLLDSDFDIMMNYAAQQWATDLAFEVLDEIKQPKVIVPCGFSGLYHPAYRAYFKKIPKIMEKYDASIYLSDNYRDINFAREHNIKKTHLIPNGAGDDEFSQPIDFSIRKKLHIPKDSFLILSVGSHTGLKGHAELIEIFKRANIQNATLLIVANNFGDGCGKSCKREALRARFYRSFRASRKQLLVKELPRIQTVAAYRAADMLLFPSNIEASPLVLFEAMASRLPFLTTDVGNSREIIKWSKGGKLLPTTHDESEISHADIHGSVALLENWRNDLNIKRFGVQGYKVWKNRFTWEIITKEYEKLYKDLIK